MNSLARKTSGARGLWLHLKSFCLEWQLIILLGCGLTAVGLGFVGLCLQARAAGESIALGKVAYQLLKLFTIQLDDPKPPLVWPLEVARFLGPLVVGFTTLVAFAVLLREQVMRLRLRRTTGHVVICGLGRKGLFLTRSFCEEGQRVVVIETDLDNNQIQPARDAGAIVMVGDAGDLELLRRAGVARARHLLAVTGDDGKNVEIALRASALLPGGTGKEEPPVQGLIHLVNPDLRALFRRHKVFTSAKDRLELRVFDFYENCARQIFEQFPLDRIPIPPAETDRTVHLVIAGFGQMGESIFLQALHVGHFANGRFLRITVIDPEADRLRRRLLQRFPAIPKLCAGEFIAAELEDAETHARLRTWCEERQAVTTIAICTDDDSHTISLALHLLPDVAQRGIPVLARLSSKAGLATLLDPAPGRALDTRPIHPFGMVEDQCAPKTLLNEQADKLARAVHRSRPKDGSAKAKTWERLDEDEKESCRHQAAHIPVKLRACGYAIGKPREGEAITAFPPPEIELMAGMEYRRACAEQLLAGRTQSSTSNPPAEATGETAWPQLPESAKEVHRDRVRAIPTILQQVGEGVCRLGSGDSPSAC